MKKKSITLNGIELWTRYQGRMVFARQLEPTKGLYPEDMSDDEQALLTPIVVGYDGQEGTDLTRLLEENTRLQGKVKDLEAQLEGYRQRIRNREASDMNDLYRDLERLHARVKILEQPWWKRSIR